MGGAGTKAGDGRAEQLFAKGKQENGRKKKDLEFSTPWLWTWMLPLKKLGSHGKAFSSWEKKWLGSCKAQMLRQRGELTRRAAPEQDSNIQERAGEVAGPSHKHQERRLCWVQKSLYAGLTGLLPCCVTPAWRRFISSVRFSSFSVFIRRVPWHFTHCNWETSPRKADPVTQTWARLSLLQPLVKAGREKTVICSCMKLKTFLFKLQNNYDHDQWPCSALFLGTTVFWQVLSLECVLTEKSLSYPLK